jgi:NADPH:quinone reductase-like Zn-dependent oxidoreductase
MRAVAVRAFREAPELMDLPRPSPRPGEVLVQMAAAGVNPFDWKIIDGMFDGRRPHVFPLVLGVDGAGRVEAVGAGVSRFRPGDPIFGQFLHDPVGVGTFAEFATVPESIGVSQFPSDLGPVEAAALPTAGMTALDSLDRLELAVGSTLLVVGASGGVGSFATQLAAARGIRVIAVARPASTDRLRALGAREIVDASSEDLVERVRAVQPDGFDCVLDMVSDRSRFARMAALVRPGGRIATTVFVADPPPAQARGVLAINIDLKPSSALLDRLVQETVTRHLRVPVERRVPLSEAPEAIAESRSGRAAGKTVIVVCPM